MSQARTLWSAAVIAIFCFAGCSSINKGNVGGSGGSTEVSLTIHDAFPVGISVVSLQVQVMSATLQPGNIALVKTPVTVDLAQLQTDTAFLGTAAVPFGSYTGLTVTFANPLVTIVNNTGGPITPAGTQTSCLAGAVCQYTPQTAQGGLIVPLTSAPFPLSINSTTPVGLELDMDIADLIQTDESLNFFNTGAMSVTQLPSVASTAELRQIDHVLGTVKSIAVNQFTFTNAFGEVFTVNSTSTTLFSYPAAQCVANNFSCVTAGQILDVTMSLLGNGTLTAKEIDFEDISGSSDVEGVIVTLTGTPPTSFEIAAHAILPTTVSNISIGEDTDVTVKSGASFAVDNHLFNIPAGLTFTSASNLLVGQEVLAHITGNVTAGPPALFTADRVLLRRSQITALVQTPPPANGTGSFTINTLPSFLQSAQPTNILSITCELTAQTQFDLLTPNTSAGIMTGNNVSVAGFLFPQPNGTPLVPTLATQKVRGQPLPGQ